MTRKSIILVLTIAAILGYAMYSLQSLKAENDYNISRLENYCNAVGMQYIGQRVQAHEKGLCKG